MRGGDLEEGGYGSSAEGNMARSEERAAWEAASLLGGGQAGGGATRGGMEAEWRRGQGAAAAAALEA